MPSLLAPVQNRCGSLTFAKAVQNLAEDGVCLAYVFGTLPLTDHVNLEKYHQRLAMIIGCCATALACFVFSILLGGVALATYGIEQIYDLLFSNPVDLSAEKVQEIGKKIEEQRQIFQQIRPTVKHLVHLVDTVSPILVQRQQDIAQLGEAYGENSSSMDDVAQQLEGTRAVVEQAKASLAFVVSYVRDELTPQKLGNAGQTNLKNELTVMKRMEAEQQRHSQLSLKMEQLETRIRELTQRVNNIKTKLKSNYQENEQYIRLTQAIVSLRTQLELIQQQSRASHGNSGGIREVRVVS